VLDFGQTTFPVLEGQSIGILPPGLDANGNRHLVRLYSVASPRDGERPGHNNVALTIKRVTVDHEGNTVYGVGSNYMCDLKVGDQVEVVGCTGTGSAPMRAMTEYRRRRVARKEGGELLLFFGARAPEELPYFGPLMKLPKEFIDVNLALRPRRRLEHAQIGPFGEEPIAHRDVLTFKRREARISPPLPVPSPD
jgi:benzoyl-CoA 2,3-dioxygenase component A